jgi:hypothetical protein
MEEIDVDENLFLVDPSSRRGLREVVSLNTDEALVLKIDAVSNPREGGGMLMGTDIPEIPEIDDAGDRNPLKWMSVSSELDMGRLSG